MQNNCFISFHKYNVAGKDKSNAKDEKNVYQTPLFVEKDEIETSWSSKNERTIRENLNCNYKLSNTQDPKLETKLPRQDEEVHSQVYEKASTKRFKYIS